MNVITATSNEHGSPSMATAEGHASRSGLIGREYTDAYSLGLTRVEPGGCVPTRVGERNQAFFVIEGEGIASLAGRSQEIFRGALIKVPRGVPHELRNTGAVPMQLLAIHDPPREIITSTDRVCDEPGPTIPLTAADATECMKAPEIVATGTIAWKAFEAAGVQGYELKPSILGQELTDAYSVDLMRVAPGGFSAAHTDQGRHAFVILAGQGRLTIDGQTFHFNQGDIVKVPQGSLHALHNDAVGALEFLAIYDPPRRRGQAESAQIAYAGN